MSFSISKNSLPLRAIEAVSRVVLSGAFIWAAASKIPKPMELAETIMGYKMAPEPLIAPLALILPFVELWAALAALIGPKTARRAGALILLILLIAFMAAAAQGLIRGLDFDCGCFGGGDGRKPGVLFFLQDGALALAALIIFINGKDLKA